MIAYLVVLAASAVATAAGAFLCAAGIRGSADISDSLLRRIGAGQPLAKSSWQWPTAAVVWIAVTLWARLYLAALLPAAVVAWRRLAVRRARARTTRLFEEQFEQAAVTMANGLRAGQSLAQAMATVEREYGPPLGSEFRRALQEYQAGVPVIKAIDGIRLRIPCPETAFLARALGIHGLTGGNVAGVLGNVSRIVRQRRLLRGEVTAKSGEARLTAVVLAALPGLLAGYLLLVDRAMLAPLLTTPIGRAGLVYGVISWLVGVAVISRMASSVGGT